MAKIQLSDRAVSYLGILTIVLCLCEAIALTVAFGFPDFTCAHVPALAPWADNFLWLAFLNAGFTLGNWIRDSDIRYTKLPDDLPEKELESNRDSLRERAELESAYGRYDRYLLATAVYLTTFLLGYYVHKATVGTTVCCTQWKAAANGDGLQ
ncbi:hypothetical protein KC357_g8102 [Hortaea werneckii]|nr:hypothetical protein KC357_g8102 [Hortaea werneckii]